MKGFLHLLLAELTLVGVVVVVERGMTRQHLGVRLLVDQKKGYQKGYEEKWCDNDASEE